MVYEQSMVRGGACREHLADLTMTAESALETFTLSFKEIQFFEIFYLGYP